MAAANEAGVVYRRCACRDDTGRQLGARCLRMAADPGHGRWYFALQVAGPEHRRVRVRRGGFASRGEAEQACLETGRLPSPEAIAATWSMKRYLEFWLSRIDGKLRPTTVLNYRSIVYRYLIPALGDYRLGEVGTRDCQRAMDRISATRVRGDRLMSPGTVHRVRATLRTALSEARRQGMIGWNPAWGLRLPEGARPHPVVWDERRENVWRETGIRPRLAIWDLPHVGRFLTEVQDDALFPLWWLVALLGLRRGEVAALRWEDLDLAAGELHVREQVVVVGGVEYVGPTKSAAGVRTLALDEMTVRILWALWDRGVRLFGRPGPKDRVFRHPDGRSVRSDWLSRRFAALVRELDLPPSRLHDLRHSAASLAGASGTFLKEIQHGLGHASAVTTAEYMCSFPATARMAVGDAARLLLSHARIRMSLDGSSQA